MPGVTPVRRRTQLPAQARYRPNAQPSVIGCLVVELSRVFSVRLEFDLRSGHISVARVTPDLLLGIFPNFTPIADLFGPVKS